jgi:hypothetical protein
VDPKRLDELSRRFSAASSRRAALGVLAGGAVASAVGLFRQEEVAAKGIPILHCKLPGAKCSGKGRNSRCCSRVCTDGLCGCKKKGKPCFDNGGQLCCSGKCRNGECT